MYWQHIFIRCHIFCSFSHLAPSPMGFSKALSTSSASCSATSCSPRSLRAPRPPAASPWPTCSCPPCSCPLPPDFASSLSLKLGLRPRFGLGSGMGLRPDCLKKFRFASFLLSLKQQFKIPFTLALHQSLVHSWIQLSHKIEITTNAQTIDSDLTYFQVCHKADWCCPLPLWGSKGSGFLGIGCLRPLPAEITMTMHK